MTDQLKIVIVGNVNIGRAITAGVASDVEAQVVERPFDISVMGSRDSFRYIESTGHHTRVPKPAEDWKGKGKRKMRRQR